MSSRSKTHSLIHMIRCPNCGNIIDLCNLFYYCCPDCDHFFPEDYEPDDDEI